MTYMRYTPTGKNKWAIVDGMTKLKKGAIRQRRTAFVAELTRHCLPTQLDNICAYVAYLNGEC